MPDRGYQHRKEWNAKNYKQIKADVPPDLAAAFKAACEANNEPVRQVLIGLMGEYAQTAPKARKAASLPSYDTRKKRREAVGAILSALGSILEAEEGYRDGIPESMENRRESADMAISAIEDAIASLEEAFS
jgi:hypothetical protein